MKFLVKPVNKSKKDDPEVYESKMVLSVQYYGGNGNQRKFYWPNFKENKISNEASSLKKIKLIHKFFFYQMKN